jgi:putative endopeptidase
MKISFFTFLILFFSQFASAAELKIIPTREFALSTNIKPCENFYQYVCAAEIEKFVLPSHRSRYTFFYSDAYENLLSTTDAAIQEFKESKNLSPRGNQISQYYAACIDKTSRAAEENEIVEKTRKDIDAIKTHNELIEYIKQKTRRGVLKLLSYGTAPHTLDPKIWRLEVWISATTLPEKTHYNDKETMTEYNQLLVDFFKAIKIDQPEERAFRALEIEKAFAKTEPTTLEAEKRWDYGDYLTQKFFINKYPTLNRILELSSLSSKWAMHLYTPEIYDFTENALQTADLQSLKDFLLFRMLRENLDFAYSDWRASYQNFKSKRMGFPSQRRPLEQECGRIIQDEFGRELAAEMVTTVFKKYPKDEFIALVKKIRQSFLLAVEANQWLSPKSRKQAIKKIKSLHLALLYPDDEKNWNFAPIKNFSKDSYIKNKRLRNLAYREKAISDLKTFRNLDAWSTSPLYFDATYFRAENRFYFPAGFAMKPIFDPQQNELKSLATIGVLVGHELGHALDATGIKYNEDGIKKNIFTKKDRAYFKKLEKVFIKQFDEAGHNGELTLSENIADHIGLISGFEAAFPRNSKNNIEKKKQFFIHYAQSWCTSMTDNYRKSHLIEDNHALPESRVNEQLKHLPAFGETFQCAKNAKMVLPNSKRIRIW